MVEAHKKSNTISNKTSALTFILVYSHDTSVILISVTGDTTRKREWKRKRKKKNFKEREREKRNEKKRKNEIMRPDNKTRTTYTIKSYTHIQNERNKTNSCRNSGQERRCSGNSQAKLAIK